MRYTGVSFLSRGSAMTWQDQYQQDGSAADLFQRYIVPRITSLWAKDLVERAGVRVGENVLDVACGTGVVSRLAAERSCTGRVIGLDLNADMLRVAGSIAHADGTSIAWREGTALALPFEEGEFDVILCQLGLQFFPDKSLALREMARVLRFGGRLALSVSPPSNGLLSRTLSRTPSTGISAKVRLQQSVPSTPSRIQMSWRNLLLTLG
jgi:ubiquinone/menaquinone biosynthesis C-methylase UbiE